MSFSPQRGHAFDGDQASDGAGGPFTGTDQARLIMLAHAGSTNTVLGDLIREEWADGHPTAPFTTVATLDQRGGRGRLDRIWAAPRGAALAVSVAFTVPSEHVSLLPWLPLICGASAREAMNDLGVHAGVKWPNDLLIGGRKVCGILSELVSVPTPAAPIASGDLPVLVGFGINLAQTADQFASAGLDPDLVTSLEREGAQVSGEQMLHRLLTRLRQLWSRALSGDTGVFDTVREGCVTIGQPVRVVLPAADDLVGVATGLDDGGRLLVSADGQTHALSVGDVTHVRPAGR